MYTIAVFFYSLIVPLALVCLMLIIWVFRMLRREKRRRIAHKLNIKRAILCG